MATLCALPVELLDEIFQYLVETPHNIITLVKIKGRLSTAARPYLHHRETIQFAMNNQIAIPPSWLIDAYVLRGLRHLTINTKLPDKREAMRGRTFQILHFYSTMNFTPLVTLIRRLSRLESVVWACKMPMPMEVLDAIHTHPPAALTITDYTRHFEHPYRIDPVETALSQSPALRQIDGQIYMALYGMPTDGSAPTTSLAEAAFRRIVACAPNLSSASLKIGLYPGYLLDDETRAQVKRKVRMYKGHGCQSSSLRSLKVLAESFTHVPMESTLRNWARDVQLKTLEHVQGSSMPVLPYFSTSYESASMTLAGLKEVALDAGSPTVNDHVLLKNYFQDIGPLEVLHLHDWHYHRALLPDILERHGESLRVLILHNPGWRPWGYRPPLDFIGLKDLTLIGKHCLSLHELSVEVLLDRKQLEVSQYAELFCLLASIRASHVSLRFDLGLHCRNNLLNNKYLRSTHLKRFVADVWKILFRDCPTSRGPELEIFIGDGGSCFDPWFWYDSSHWVAKPNERDDMFGHCVVTGECSEAEQEEQRKAARTTIARLKDFASPVKNILKYWGLMKTIRTFKLR